MNLVLHLVRWDVRRFRPHLAVWLLLVAGSAVLDGAWPVLALNATVRQTVGVAGNLVALAEVLFSIVLVALVVQEHPLVGTTAFWMTRPIPPRALLAEKLLVLGVAVIAAPVGAEIALMAAYGIRAEQIAAVAVQTALVWTLWLGFIMTLAALTQNLARFALLMGGLLGVAIVIIGIAVAIMIDRIDVSPPAAHDAAIEDPTSGVVHMVLLIVTIIVLLVVLYRSRARALAVAVGVAGIVVAIGVEDVWPWPFLAPRIQLPAWTSDPRMLQLAAIPGTVEVDRSFSEFSGRPVLWRWTHARVRLTGIAPGWSANVGVRESFVRIDGRESLTSRVPGQAVSVAIDDEERVQRRAVMRRLLEVEEVIDAETPARADPVIVLFARQADLRRIAPATGSYDGRFVVSLVRNEIEAVLPFRPGAAHRNSGYRFSLDHIYPESGRIVALARESSAYSVFDRRPPRRVAFYLRNRNTSEAIPAQPWQLRTDVTFARFIPFGIAVAESEQSGFSARASSLVFDSHKRVTFDSTWLQQSELVIVRSTEAGAVERRLAIADFPIRAE
jgi:hypothetical protein